jgi:hypothetical protein
VAHELAKKTAEYETAQKQAASDAFMRRIPTSVLLDQSYGASMPIDCEATMRSREEIVREVEDRNQFRREAGLPLLDVDGEVRHIQKYETKAELEEAY